MKIDPQDYMLVEFSSGEDVRFFASIDPQFQGCSPINRILDVAYSESHGQCLTEPRAMRDHVMTVADHTRALEAKYPESAIVNLKINPYRAWLQA